VLGEKPVGRDHLVEHAGALSLIKGDWKYIEPSKGPKINANTNTELGNAPQPQLYDLKSDLGEKNNLAEQHPEVVKEMAALLTQIRKAGRSRP
jgi:arylsulfatase A-like enzyme